MADKAVGTFERLYALIGIGIVVPIILCGVLFMLVKYLGTEQKDTKASIVKLSNLAETGAKTSEAMANTLERLRIEMDDKFNRLVIALARLKQGRSDEAFDELEKKKVGG